MELEFFCEPDTDLAWFDYWRSFCHEWLKGLNMHDENLRLRDHEKEELSFYSKATTDFEYLFPFGWGELWGVADRTNYDLTQHQKFSGQDMDYFDQEKNEHYIPYVIEPSLGADRVTLAFLCEAYDEEVVDAAKNDTRVVMHFHPALAPFKCAVLPLSKKLSEPATELYHKLQKRFMCDYDEAGSIGKRYRRQDEIGTPYCVTFDFESAEDGCVTVRDRDSMQQERIPMEQLEDYKAPGGGKAYIFRETTPGYANYYRALFCEGPVVVQLDLSILMDGSLVGGISDADALAYLYSAVDSYGL